MSGIAPVAENRPLILLSNREPYEHVHGPEGVKVRQPAGGLVSALDPTMRRTHGTWVAWGSGSADRESADASGRLQVPPDNPSYTLRRVWMDEGDIEGFYLGFANRVLWPLCHMLIQHYDFREEYWERYRVVNQRFARAVAEEAAMVEGTPMVWIQDFHFSLAPEMVREMSPRLLIHQFWHIPFPPPDILRLLPGGAHAALLRGLLGNDLIEFHTDRYAGNFLDCIRQHVPEATVDGKQQCVSYRGRTVHVGAFPISIDVDRYDRLATSSESAALASRLRARYTKLGRQIGVSVDRIDYTKGIPERLQALELLWTESPELREAFTIVLVATPSRSEVPAYRTLECDIVGTVHRINQRFGSASWTPIVLIHHNVDAEQLAPLYRAADFCIVSSLQDGMNLVAKEFIACQVEERGTLVLSRFAGAAEEIDGAILINPFNIEGVADGIRRALAVAPAERRQRMQGMRGQLRESTIFDWLEAILARASALMPQPVEVTG